MSAAPVCAVCLKRPAKPDRLWPEVKALCRPCMTSLFWAMTKTSDGAAEGAPFNFDALIVWTAERTRKVAKPCP